MSHLHPFPPWPDAVLSDVFSPLDLLAGTWIHRGTEGGGGVRGEGGARKNKKDNTDKSQNHLLLYNGLILYRNSVLIWSVTPAVATVEQEVWNPYYWHKMSRAQPFFQLHISQWAQNT